MRVEIVKAAHTLVAQIAEEQESRRQSEFAAIRRDCELVVEALRGACREYAGALRTELRKAGYNPNEPRVPAGNPDGGQWTRESGSASINDPRVVSDATPDNNWIPGAQYAANDPPGIGHNRGPPLEEPPPSIPPTAPLRQREIWNFVKAAVRWLIKFAPRVAWRVGLRVALEGTIGGPVGDFLLAVEAVWWLNYYRPTIYSYFDPPKTWEELQKNSGSGYDKHHVVERWTAKDGMPSSKIYSPDNVVPIPKLKHWEINSWLDTPNDEFKDADGQKLSPRDYMRDKTWEERYRFGLFALRKFGVLAP